MAKSTKQFVITQQEFGRTLYIEPSQPGCINWTDDVKEARIWTSQKLAQKFMERWVLYTSGWNAQTDTRGLTRKRPGVAVTEIVVD